MPSLRCDRGASSVRKGNRCIVLRASCRSRITHRCTSNHVEESEGSMHIFASIHQLQSTIKKLIYSLAYVPMQQEERSDGPIPPEKNESVMEKSNPAHTWMLFFFERSVNAFLLMVQLATGESLKNMLRHGVKKERITSVGCILVCCNPLLINRLK